MAKLSLLVVAAFLLVQVMGASPRARRDTPAAPPGVSDEGSSLSNIKDNIDSFIKDTVKPEKLWEDFTTNLKSFGEKVQSGAKDLANTVQQKTSEIFDKKPAPAA